MDTQPTTDATPDVYPYLQQLYERGGSDMFFSVGSAPQVKVEGRTQPVGEHKGRGLKGLEKPCQRSGPGRVMLGPQDAQACLNQDILEALAEAGIYPPQGRRGNTLRQAVGVAQRCGPVLPQQVMQCKHVHAALLP